MSTYRQIHSSISSTIIIGISRLFDNAFIPFDPANTDYQRFKRDILSGTVTLQDADGNTLSSASAITYVNQLP